MEKLKNIKNQTSSPLLKLYGKECMELLLRTECSECLAKIACFPLHDNHCAYFLSQKQFLQLRFVKKLKEAEAIAHYYSETATSALPELTTTLYHRCIKWLLGTVIQAFSSSLVDAKNANEIYEEKMLCDIFANFLKENKLETYAKVYLTKSVQKELGL